VGVEFVIATWGICQAVGTAWDGVLQGALQSRGEWGT